MRGRCRAERGSTLLVVSVLLVAFLLAAALLATRALETLRQVRDFSARNQAFYVAESGVSLLSERLRAAGRSAPSRLEVKGELDAGPFEGVAVRVDIPGADTDRPPVYVVTSRGRHAGRQTVLSGRAVLEGEGLRFQQFRYGEPEEAWFEPWVRDPEVRRQGPPAGEVEGRPDWGGKSR